MEIHKLSSNSRKHLKGCEPVLTDFTERTLIYSPHDLSVLHTSTRTFDEQREYVGKGVSKTMDSMHLPRKASGLSGAVDLGIYIKGVNVWKLPSVYDLYEDVHAAAQIAAREMDLNIISGTCWANLNQDVDYQDLLWSYRARKRKLSVQTGRRHSPFFDGPHFELLRSEYP